LILAGPAAVENVVQAGPRRRRVKSQMMPTTATIMRMIHKMVIAPFLVGDYG
jgi:hypothetical protein